MKTKCSIRKMQESDIKNLSQGFISQGWPSREEILTLYFKEQESGEREPFQNQGIGNLLLEEAEKRVKLISDKVTLGVGLHSGYGPAQRLYIKRGYIPDGTGVWYRNQPLEMNATIQNNDDLVLYLSKELE